MGTSLEKRKRMRKQVIFDLIKKNDNQLSRNDLSKATSYSITAIAETVDELIRENKVFESESSDQRIGRPPVLLSINPNCYYSAGIECSSYSISIEVVNAVDETVYTDSLYLTSPKSEDLLSGIRQILTAFSSEQPAIWTDTQCVTISLPGKLDTENGIGISYASIPDWKMVDVKGYLKQYFAKKFIFMNNIDSMLIGYRFINRVPEDSSTLFIMIRNGTGIRFFANNALLSSYGIVCEFGHAKALHSNRLCACGKKGCYDSEITSIAIINKLKEYMMLHDHHLSHSFLSMTDEHQFILEFFRLVKEGNQYANEIFNDCSFHIANLLTQVLLVSNADTVVLSSEMCHIMPLFQEKINDYLSQNKVVPLPQIDFVLPQNNFGSVGAAIWNYQFAFSEQADTY